MNGIKSGKSIHNIRGQITKNEYNKRSFKWRQRLWLLVV